MKLYSYIVKYDTGLAPNPFHEWCTLAICKPNHMGIKATSGDWIVGFSDVKHGNKLLFAMNIHDVLHFDRYHRDTRFAAKIPKYTADWRDLCGDNLYFTKSGKWQRVDSPFHASDPEFTQDTKHPIVFVAQDFYYFGGNAIKTPDRFAGLAQVGRSCKHKHDPEIVSSFLSWLEGTFESGMAGEPRDAAMSQGFMNRELVTPLECGIRKTKRTPTTASHC